MNPFKNIAIFRDQLCNCLPWGKDTKKEGPWQPRLDYRELNDDPELKPTPFPEKYQYDMDYKHLLQENERLEKLVKCLVLQLGKVESPTDSQIKGKMTQINQLPDMENYISRFDGEDRRPDTATIFPRKTL